jgi:hypothetical protein
MLADKMLLDLQGSDQVYFARRCTDLRTMRANPDGSIKIKI